MFERKKPSGKLLSLPIDQIHPSPFQARKSFDEQELTALAQSIRENGLLQPVTVRRAAEGYELVAGERRLRACQLAKMTTIPAILCSYADDRTAALGLLENIQRADLNPFEQAQGLRDVMVLWDCTQAEAAKRLGMAQPTFANKLRLLQLTADQRQFVLDNNLTERHARAVLRLPENRRSEALITIAKRRLNARQTDSYIEQLLNSPPKAGHRISMVRDVRIFVNTIDHAIRLMTDNGVPATAHRGKRRTATSSTPCASPPPPRRSKVFHVEQGREGFCLPQACKDAPLGQRQGGVFRLPPPYLWTPPTRNRPRAARP